MLFKDDDFCTLSANEDGKCKTASEDLMVAATGWKVPIFVEKPSESSTLEKFLHIQPPKRKKSKFIKDGEIFMIPGLPETLVSQKSFHSAYGAFCDFGSKDP